MNPKDLKYTSTHEWVRLAGDTATIGITDHAAHALSDLVYLGLPKKGDKVAAGKAWPARLLSPLQGYVAHERRAVAVLIGVVWVGCRSGDARHHDRDRARRLGL